MRGNITRAIFLASSAVSLGSSSLLLDPCQRTQCAIPSRRRDNRGHLCLGTSASHQQLAYLNLIAVDAQGDVVAHHVAFVHEDAWNPRGVHVHDAVVFGTPASLPSTPHSMVHVTSNDGQHPLTFRAGMMDGEA